MKVTHSFSGISDVDQKLIKLANKTPSAKRKATLETADAIMAISVDIAPFDESTLIKSAFTRNEGDDEARIYYTEPYAARLHEHPEYNFQNNRQGKYLEEPLFGLQDEWHKNFSLVLKRELGL